MHRSGYYLTRPLQTLYAMQQAEEIRYRNATTGEGLTVWPFGDMTTLDVGAPSENVSVTAYDEQGQEVAMDEIVVRDGMLALPVGLNAFLFEILRQ